MPPNLKSIVEQVKQQWRKAGRASKAADQISFTVRPAAAGGVKSTTVKIVDHDLPDVRRSNHQALFTVTQKPQFLTNWHFDDVVISKLGEASVEKGRIIYCLRKGGDLADPVLAAISFHVPSDEDLPVQVIAVALRLFDDDAVAQSYVAAWYLTQYVQALSKKLGRPECVDYVIEELNISDELRLLGFEQMKPKPYPTNGRLFRQAPSG